MERLTIAEAARRWHLSQDTIRRRIRRGELRAHRDPTPQGFTWVVDAPETTETTQAVEAATPASLGGSQVLGELINTAQVMRELMTTVQAQVSTQREELKSRRREVQELHVLLHQLQTKALPPPRQSWWRSFWRHSAEG